MAGLLYRLPAYQGRDAATGSAANRHCSFGAHPSLAGKDRNGLDLTFLIEVKSDPGVVAEPRADPRAVVHGKTSTLKIRLAEARTNLGSRKAEGQRDLGRKNWTGTDGFRMEKDA